MTYYVSSGTLNPTHTHYRLYVDGAEEFWYVLQRKSGEVRAQRSQLKQIEDLSAGLEERLILDNRYLLVDSLMSYMVNIRNKNARFDLLNMNSVYVILECKLWCVIVVVVKMLLYIKWCIWWKVLSLEQKLNSRNQNVP